MSAAQPIPLNPPEIAIMEPYLQQAASALTAYQTAQASLDAIARTIAGRAGAPENAKFSLDWVGKRLIPRNGSSKNV